MTVQLSKTEVGKVQTARLLSNSKPLRPGFSANIYHWSRLARSDECAAEIYSWNPFAQDGLG